MNALNVAIYEKLKNDPSLSAKVTGIFHVLAPQGKGLPYITYQQISGSPSYTFTENFEECVYQLNIWSESSKVAGEIFEEVKRLLDKSYITLDSWQTVKCFREFNEILFTEDAFNLPVRYRIELQRGKAFKTISMNVKIS